MCLWREWYFPSATLWRKINSYGACILYMAEPALDRQGPGLKGPLSFKNRGP